MQWLNVYYLAAGADPLPLAVLSGWGKPRSIQTFLRSDSLAGQTHRGLVQMIADFSKRMASIAFFSFIALVAHAQAASAQSTGLRVCNNGSKPVYAAVYDTYQGLLSGYEVSGWYAFRGRDCMREAVESRGVRAYAFATVNEDGAFVALPFDFNLRRGGFGRSTRTLCVPVQVEMEPFRLSSGNQSDVVAPCGPGQVALRTSFNLLGGDQDSYTLRVAVPSSLPPPDPDYARIWSERFGPAVRQEKAELSQAEVERRRAARERLLKREQARQQELEEKEARERERRAACRTAPSREYEEGGRCALNRLTREEVFR